MRFGICILPDMPWRDARPLWEEAEQMGFDHAWTYDHLVWGGLPDSTWFSCIPTLTAAAMVTTRIGLGPFVSSPNFRHPATLAREAQTLADISGDRLLLGLGAGGTPDDTLTGDRTLPPRQRVDRLQEFTRMLDLCLREDHAGVEGEYFAVGDLRRVGQPPRDRIPLLLAGNGPRSVRFAAREADGWITTGTPSDDLDTWFTGVARSVEILDTTLAETGRDQGFARYLSLDSGPRQSLESIGVFDEMVGRAGGLGFTDLIVHRPRLTEPHRAPLEVLEKVAARGLPH
ncbi:LLM class flavin-dependent oxidoreductase [Williamsia sterculiae]|uniref:Luciferase-like monooxygenase n=1 Tax=Williamsia sterculiae TaxID=1344003 RepID=A0A1N7GJK5_9NOCA|nr:LLM class flavin-dependent oxidoreductase [Williamsia sterculiae]SIS12712.1 Luciferase-like monooxygenase [Williamsia sterculiae]